MLAWRILSLVLFVFLISCGGSAESDSGGNSGFEKPQNNGFNDLFFAPFNEDLRGERNNAVVLRITPGLFARYTYRFQSEDATLMQIMQISYKSSCTDLTVRLVLEQGNHYQEVIPGTAFALQPGQSYNLNVSVENPRCSSEDISLDVIAWKGSKKALPKLSLLCDGSPSNNVLFVMNVNYLTAISSLAGKENYLGGRFYCGEYFRDAKETCKSSVDLNQKPLLADRVECESINIKKRKMAFQVNFNRDQKSAQVICKTNDSVTHSRDYEQCRPLLIDYLNLQSVLQELDHGI